MEAGDKLIWENENIHEVWNIIAINEMESLTNGRTWEKSRWKFEEIINNNNARKIPKGEIGDIQSHIPRHKFL